MPLRPDPDALGFVLIDVARMLRSAFERRISTAGLGLTPGEARTLVRIATLEGSRQLDIAQRMGIEPMTLSTYLDRLQSLGFIERRPDPADRRATQVRLTPSGLETNASILADRQTHSEQYFAVLSPTEQEQLAELLLKLSDGAAPRP